MNAADSDILSAQSELAARMQRPQRHRLLQGFPPLPLMQQAIRDHPKGLVRLADGAVIQSKLSLAEINKGQSNEWEDPFINIDKSRPLIIGIIPPSASRKRPPAVFALFPTMRQIKACAPPSSDQW